MAKVTDWLGVQEARVAAACTGRSLELDSRPVSTAAGLPTFVQNKCSGLARLRAQCLCCPHPTPLLAGDQGSIAFMGGGGLQIF